MSADEVARRQLQERLLDDVELPSEVDREAMFERTFASPPGAGQELLPPDGFFDAAADDSAADDPDAEDLGPDDPADGSFDDAEAAGDGAGDPFSGDVPANPVDDGHHGSHGDSGEQPAADQPGAEW